jgi:hypothetical protein
MKYELPTLPARDEIRVTVTVARLNTEERRMLGVLTEHTGVKRSQIMRFLIASAYEQLTQAEAA